MRKNLNKKRTTVVCLETAAIQIITKREKDRQVQMILVNPTDSVAQSSIVKCSTGVMIYGDVKGD